MILYKLQWTSKQHVIFYVFFVFFFEEKIDVKNSYHFSLDQKVNKDNKWQVFLVTSILKSIGINEI